MTLGQLGRHAPRIKFSSPVRSFAMKPSRTVRARQRFDFGKQALRR
jgi:hypothetical protein